MAEGAILGTIYVVMLTMEGIPIKEIEHQMTVIETTSTISIIGIVLGAFISAFVGYFCAKTVGHSEYKVVFILGLVVVSIDLLMSFSYYSLIENTLFSVITLVCVFFGAWLFVRSKTTGSPTS